MSQIYHKNRHLKLELGIEMTKHFSHSFKLKIVNKILKDKYTVKKVSHEHDIAVSTLYNWISRYKTNEKFDKKGKLGADNSVQRQKLLLENAILKKALHINDDTTSKFQFIYENKEHFSIRAMCELLNVSPSGYYKFSRNFTSPQEYKKKQIEALVKDIYFKHNGNIGSPLITNVMNKDKYHASQATVARILEENKTSWHETYTQFHDNKDVQLHFNNKDSIYDLSTKSFFHETYAQKELKNLYNSYSMTNFKMHNKENIMRINSCKC